MNLRDQVWLPWIYLNFKYCTFYVSVTDFQTNEQSDDLNTKYPKQTFQAGGIKRIKTDKIPQYNPQGLKI